MLLLFLTWQINYANCRNTGTLAGDLAGNNFVRFLTRLNPILFERNVQIVLMTNI